MPEKVLQGNLKGREILKESASRLDGMQCGSQHA
jgi:hypothetical protein